MYKRSVWDIVFIVILTIVLLILSETGNLDLLAKLPFVTIYVAYAIGRFVGHIASKRKEV